MAARIDDLTHPLEEIRFRKKIQPLVISLEETTHFTPDEIEVLLILHYKATREGPLDRKRFREMMHRSFNMTNERLQDAIFVLFDTKGIVNMTRFVQMLSLYCRGTLDEKIEYAFRVYDPFGTGHLTKDSLFKHMRKTVIKLGPGEDMDETVKEMAEIWLRKIDADRDGKISLEDFRKSVKKNPMILEALGDVIPRRDVINSCLSTCFELESVGRF